MTYEPKLGPNAMEQRKLPFTTFCVAEGCHRWPDGAQKDPETLNLCREREPSGCTPCEGCNAYRAVYYGYLVPGYVPPIDKTKEWKRSNI